MLLTEGLVEFWKLNETSGTRNGSLGAFNLSEIGGASTAAHFNPENNTAQQGTGCLVEVAGPCLAVPTAAALNVNSGNFSLSCWVTMPAFTIDQSSIVGKGTLAENFQYGIDYRNFTFNPGSFVFYIGTGTGATSTNTPFTQVAPQYITPVSPALNKWYFLCGVWAAPTLQFWINNEKAGIQDVAGAFTGSTNSKFAIGGNVTSVNGIGKPLNGSVTNVGLWNRALRREEIGNLYNGGLGLTYPFNQLT